MNAVDRLAALEQAHAAATPGPWHVHPADASEVVGMWKSEAEAEDGWEGIDVCGARTPIPGTVHGDSKAEDANAAAIVASFNATPLLIAALRAVLELADRWERGATRWETPLPVPPEVALVRSAIDAALGEVAP